MQWYKNPSIGILEKKFNKQNLAPFDKPTIEFGKNEYSKWARDSCGLN